MREKYYDQDQKLRVQKIDIQMIHSKGNQKCLIVNVPSQNSDTHFGKVNIAAKIETEEIKSDYKSSKQKDYQYNIQDDKDAKKQKGRQIQILKMQIQSSAKKNKIFTLNMPITKSIKKSGDSKIHFLLQLKDKKAVLTIADEYAECRMNIKGNQKVQIYQAVQKQKKRMDRRRKNSYDQENAQHNDPDMKGNQEQDD